MLTMPPRTTLANPPPPPPCWKKSATVMVPPTRLVGAVYRSDYTLRRCYFCWLGAGGTRCRTSRSQSISHGRVAHNPRILCPHTYSCQHISIHLGRWFETIRREIQRQLVGNRGTARFVLRCVYILSRNRKSFRCRDSIEQPLKL